jgi:steroid 5-alpha reductase family enzyme
MKSDNLQAAFAIAVALCLAAAVAWAGSHGAAALMGLPLLAWCAIATFAVQWVVFIPSYWLQTEHYYDLAGCATYLLLLVLVAWAGPPLGSSGTVLLLLCAVWALRLGSFLFLRIQRVGKDSRFDAIKPHPLRFLMAWTLQGLWVFLTLCAVLVFACSSADRTIGATFGLGICLWLLGFGLEVLADRQKQLFRSDPRNHGRFIQSGLWAVSRHPNYLGEILLWLGIFVCVAPSLQGWQWVGVVSPVFVFLLITRISGVPLLEAQAELRWGADAAYQAYKDATPVLWPTRILSRIRANSL